ncbi:MAG: hypothetical protein N2Z20_05725 [Elusimicrobiales bacterium]|nr:hypothetical protein [Elusimicrobiales bacterium]
MKKKCFFFLFFFSCSLSNVKEYVQNNSSFEYKYCSVHFCFYSNENIHLKDFVTKAENIYHYFISKYSFSLPHKYPYKFFIGSGLSNFNNKENELIYISSIEFVSEAVISCIISEIFSHNKEIYPWLYYGFIYWVVLDFDSSYLSYINVNKDKKINMPVEMLFNLSSDMILGKDNLFYKSNLVSLISFIINKYSYISFSLFVEDLFKTGNPRISSLNIFGKDVFLEYERMLR